MAMTSSPGRAVAAVPSRSVACFGFALYTCSNARSTADDVVITRAVYCVPATRSVTEFWPSTTWLLVTTRSGRMKNPLPRPVPVSIDATAGSEALTTSSIVPVGTVATVLDAAGAGPVRTMLPLTGATNVSEVCATVSCTADSVTLGVSDGTTSPFAKIGAGSLVCTMYTATPRPMAAPRIRNNEGEGPLRALVSTGSGD